MDELEKMKELFDAGFLRGSEYLVSSGLTLLEAREEAWESYYKAPAREREDRIIDDG